jgi:hypothetical protein
MKGIKILVAVGCLLGASSGLDAGLREPYQQEDNANLQQPKCWRSH